MWIWEKIGLERMKCRELTPWPVRSRDWLDEDYYCLGSPNYLTFLPTNNTPHCSHKTHFFPLICGELYDGRWLLLRGHYYTTVGFVGFHPITVNIDVRFCSLQDSEREEDKEAVIVLWGYYGPMLNRHQSIHMIYHQTRLRDTKLITLGSQYYQKTRAQNIGGKEQPGTIIQSCQWRVMMASSQHST